MGIMGEDGRGRALSCPVSLCSKVESLEASGGERGLLGEGDRALALPGTNLGGLMGGKEGSWIGL